VTQPIRIEGLVETSRALRRLSVKGALTPDLREAARPVVSRAASITVRGGRGDRHAGQLSRSYKVHIRRGGAKIISDTPYSAARMFARIIRVPASERHRAYVRHVKPDPFILRALEQERGTVERLAAGAIQRAAQRVFEGRNG